MKFLQRLLLIALNLGLFALLFGMLVRDPLPRTGPDRFIYGTGSAEGATRADLNRLLDRFANGYSQREVAKAEAFVDQLFVGEEPVVLGTLPTEIFRGGQQVKRLVRSDWESWGDCRFQMESAAISSRGDVAWIAAHGRVTFDLSRFLVVPLRLSAVALKGADGWRFQQVQFQFDLDLGRVLAANLLLILWLVVNLGLLAWELGQWFRKRPGRA
jgi:hypothetical protein